MTGPAFERFRLLSQGEEDSLQYCSNCKNCDISCPNQVPISTLNMLARGEYSKVHRPRLRDWFVSHGPLLYNIFSFLPMRMINFGMNNPVTRQALDMLGIHKKAPLPSFAGKSFKKRFKEIRQPEGLKKKIVFFPGCYVDIYDPQIGVDLVELLNITGYEVIVPDGFVCCGLPVISNGFPAEAEKNALRNSEELTKWTKLGVPVMTACPSCSLMLKQEYKDLFPSVEKAGFGAYNVMDACEFFVDMIDSGEYKPEFTGEMVMGMYHPPCHLRAQGMGRPGLDLLRRIPGSDVVDADAGCCGISGSYGFKKDKYDISMAIGSDLFDVIRHSGRSRVFTECGTCQVQIRHGSGANVMHPVSVFRRSVR